jgi:hypothetical protein
LEHSDDPGGEFKFRPGQYATLGVQSTNKRSERAYAIVSSPHENEVEFFIEITLSTGGRVTGLTAPDGLSGYARGSLARRRDGCASDPIPHVERTLGLAHGVGMRARPGIERGKRLVERAPEWRHRIRHPGRRSVDDAPFHDPVALEAPYALRQRLLRHAGDLAS